ncbi:MAG: hypothetical protein KGH89_08225 [Thaumarchaeota archaeon]|nr:hypothetical protein [Nitrososphaerota archaeon]
MDDPTLGVKKKFKEYQVKTDDLLEDIGNVLTDFEKKKDPQLLYEGIKELVKKFSDV